MDENEIKIYQSYKNSAAKKYGIDKYKWNITEEEILSIDNDIINLIPENTSVLDVGCGDGRFAQRLLAKRNDIEYTGFDLVQASINEAQEKGLNVYRGNYWDELSKPGTWDFVVSQGVLFTCTDPKYKNLLMSLLDNTAKRGYIVLSIASKKPRIAELQKSLDNSINVSDYYFSGKNRPTLELPERLFNHPFWLIRENIKYVNVPEIPNKLKGFPESNTNQFFKAIEKKE